LPNKINSTYLISAFVSVALNLPVSCESNARNG